MQIIKFRSYCALALLGFSLAIQGIISPARAELKPIKAPPNLTHKEIELGKKSVEQLEKEPKFKLLDGKKDLKSQVLLDKLNEMATTLGKVSARPLIKYNVKVFEETDVNAFTLPGGHIYVSRGLLDLAASDDEIAAVIAHEIGHNARMHVLREQQKEKPLQWLQIAAMLAMIKGGQGGANIAQILPYILTGVVNKYSIVYEKEADECAIEQMRQTSYNPSAMVTFMQKLDDEDKRHPEVQLGIYQDHPVSSDRVQSALDDLKRFKIPYTPRAVTGANEAVMVEKNDRLSIMWDAQLLFEFALPKNAVTSSRTENATQAETVKPSEIKAGEGSSTGSVAPTPAIAVSPIKMRAQNSAARLNGLMRDNLRIYEISVNASSDDFTLNARGQEIARATSADAKLQNTTPQLLAQTWKANLQRLFWKESLHGSM